MDGIMYYSGCCWLGASSGSLCLTPRVQVPLVHGVVMICERLCAVLALSPKP